MSDQQEPARESAHASGVPAAAALLASSVLLSRVLGFVRDMLLAHHFGASSASDAYYAAFQIPDLMNYLLAGGALSIAFLPLYARLREQEGEEAAERLLGTVLGTLGLVALIATVGLWLAAEPLIALQFPRFDPDKRALATHLTRIVLPAQIFFVAGGVMQATLLARGRFGAAAFAPLLYNAGIIAGGLLLAPRIGVEGFSWGALVGAVLGPFLVPWLYARRRVRVRLRIAPLDRDFRRYLWVAAPLMLGQSLLTVDEWYDRWFGALLGEGSVAYLAFARKLMLVPVAAVGQAIGAAALPALTNLVAAGRRAELDRAVLATLRAGIGIGMLAAAATYVFAPPLVEFVYHRGAFTGEDAREVAGLLAIFAFAVPAWVSQQIATRTFYARGDTWRPMLLQTAIVLAAIPLYLGLGRRIGIDGLALAGVLGMTVNAVATLLLARRLHGAPALGSLVGTALRAAAVGTAAAAAAAAVMSGGSGLWPALRDLALGGAVFAAVAAAGIAWLGDAPMRAAALRVGRRLAKGRRRA